MYECLDRLSSSLLTLPQDFTFGVANANFGSQTGPNLEPVGEQATQPRWQEWITPRDSDPRDIRNGRFPPVFHLRSTTCASLLTSWHGGIGPTVLPAGELPSGLPVSHRRGS